MKTLLVQPPVNFENAYPLGPAYLAGYLRRHGVDVSGVDLGISGARSLSETLAQRSFDLVGISATSANLDAALKAATVVRRHQPGAVCVLGGPHATIAGQAPGAGELWDHLVRGDGELPLLALAQGWTDHPGVVPAHGDPDAAGVYVHPQLEDLDFPDRDVFPVAHYYAGSLKPGRWTAMIASRGCSRDCAHCAAPALSLRRFRTRSVDSVLEELRQLRTDHAVDGVLFEDDALFLDPSWADELFEAIARAELPLRFELPNGVDPMQLDADRVALLARAGVTSISLGIETLDPVAQHRLRRVIDPIHLRTVIEAARRNGIRIAGYFLIGLPGDTVASIAHDYRHIRRLDLDLAHVSVLQDLPGIDLPAPTPAGRRFLEPLGRGFYAYYYVSPSRALHAARRDGASPRQVARRLARFVRWLTR